MKIWYNFSFGWDFTTGRIAAIEKLCYCLIPRAAQLRGINAKDQVVFQIFCRVGQTKENKQNAKNIEIKKKNEKTVSLVQKQ